jgi:hypothetical protein
MALLDGKGFTDDSGRTLFLRPFVVLGALHHHRRQRLNCALGLCCCADCCHQADCLT